MGFVDPATLVISKFIQVATKVVKFIFEMMSRATTNISSLVELSRVICDKDPMSWADTILGLIPKVNHV